MDNLKEQVNSQYRCNYLEVAKSTFYQELSPNLQNQLIFFLIYKEISFFRYLFSEEVKVGDSQVVFKACFSHPLVFQLL